MLTITFLIIAHLMRHKYLDATTVRSDRLAYYVMSVVLTPLFGPLLWKSLVKSKAADPREPSTGVFPNIC
jgi:hypothetical protein